MAKAVGIDLGTTNSAVAVMEGGKPTVVVNIDLRKDRQALQRLTEAAEKARIELSSVIETNVSLPFITADASGPKHLEYKLTRAKFEQLTADLVERCTGPVKQALAPGSQTRRQ